jgi:hypothetical protein
LRVVKAVATAAAVELLDRAAQARLCSLLQAIR